MFTKNARPLSFCSFPILSALSLALVGIGGCPPPPEQPPAAPTGVTATAGDGQVTVRWNAVSGATSYNLYTASAAGVTRTNYATLADGMAYTGVTSPCVRTGLTNGTPYYFVVTAVNGDGESVESSEVSATPAAGGGNGDGNGDEGGPRLFFTDLESGPNTGGEDNLGVFVTLYGEGFGADQGSSTVTIGGQEVGRYVVWGQDNTYARSLDMIVVQLGPNVVSGEVALTVGGLASNSLPFTVRSGNIYFVSTTGSDANPGTFEQPWATVVHAKNSLVAGDTVYVMNGVSQVAEDNSSAALSIETSGAPGMPIAIVGYPAATATIGSTALEFGTRTPNIGGTQANDWVIAGLILRGQIEALSIGGSNSSRWRVVGNDISCPVGDGQTGCFSAALASHIAFLGNEVHDVSTQGAQPSKQYHAVYFTTDTVHIEVGWNHIHDNLTCRAVQFHSSPLCVPDCGPTDTTGFNQYDLTVHDNLIHGDVCDGIVFATIDPSQGPVRAFNNVIYDVGRGPAPPDGDANYTGIYVSGGTNTGPDGTGAVEIFNNTLYDCGARVNQPFSVGDEGGFGRGPGSPGLMMNLTNNVVYSINNETYLSPSSNTSLITGSNNLWFGSGNGPAGLTDNVNEDPLFENRTGLNFRLQVSSPARNTGADVDVSRDFDGIPRPQGSARDIGAFEFLENP